MFPFVATDAAPSVQSDDVERQSKDTKSSHSPAKKTYTFTEAMGKSIWGDVYAHPEDWQELSYSDFASKGWDQPWVSPPNGAGGAPRQGWLLAFEGVFYRLGIGIFSWQHNFRDRAQTGIPPRW